MNKGHLRGFQPTKCPLRPFFYVEAFYIIEVLVSTFTFNNIYKHMKSITCIINYNAIDSCPILTFTKHNISQFILKMR